MEYNSSPVPQNINVPNYPVPDNKTNQTLIFIIVILLLSIVGGGAFIFAKYLYSPKPDSSISTQQTVTNESVNNPVPSSSSSLSNLSAEKVSTPPAAVDGTANWKTQYYSNYSLRLPASWFVWKDNTIGFAQLSNFDPDNNSGSGEGNDPVRDKGFLKLEIHQEKKYAELR